jgi:hypothetical protein
MDAEPPPPHDASTRTTKQAARQMRHLAPTACRSARVRDPGTAELAFITLTKWWTAEPTVWTSSDSDSFPALPEQSARRRLRTPCFASNAAALRATAAIALTLVPEPWRT